MLFGWNSLPTTSCARYEAAGLGNDAKKVIPASSKAFGPGTIEAICELRRRLLQIVTNNNCVACAAENNNNPSYSATGLFV